MKDNDYFVKKIEEDDICSILVDHFRETESKVAELSCARSIILGTPGKDLRFVSVFYEDDIRRDYNMEEIDAKHDFNGDQSFIRRLRDNPDLYS